MTALPDACPLPGSKKRRGLSDRDRLLYAPMADVGGLLYDKDAVYIDIPDWKVSAVLPFLLSDLQPFASAACCTTGYGAH